MATPDPRCTASVEALVARFRHIAQTRMRDVPILNPAIRVEAVGFEHTAEGCLGALITPWFINLVLLPPDGEDWRAKPVGSEVRHAFASGHYRFQLTIDERIGAFQACSLLSPVLEIADQQTAVAVAQAALAALHDPEHRDTASDTRAAEIASRWHADDDNSAPPEPDAPAPSTAVADRTLSRRAFLGGGLFDDRNDTP